MTALARKLLPVGIAAALSLGACHAPTCEPVDETSRNFAPSAQELQAAHTAASPVQRGTAVSEDLKALHHDDHSYANTQDFVTRHLALDLNVDFAHKTLSGTAELLTQRLNAQAPEIVLDTRDLSIEAIEVSSDGVYWNPTPFHLDAADTLLGSALHVNMPAAANRLRIHYHTAPQASGLQWLSPEQTAGKIHPFLFSQSEAIHARSWIPLQDTPSVRITYAARIHTPPGLRAVMSANNEANGDVQDGSYRFDMPQRIPSYLLALAVGDLNFAALGDRTGIYAEPSVLQAAAHEFEDTQKMVEKAEALYGPYRWGRYDLLILPPSFPYGGMENPRLTFATPTVIAGDKSLVSLVAHELAHSWSGNLVTNATWRDFWLNEGFTSYFTNRIMEAVFGNERADMERALEADELKRELADVPAEQRMLAPSVKVGDADNIPSVVAYNRGSLFLYNLEIAFGRPLFDAFLRSWFDEHAFTSQNTEAFVDFLNQRLLAAHPGVFPLEKAKAWIYAADIPADAVYPHAEAFQRVDSARAAWLAGTLPAEQLGAAQWNVLHWTYFLDNLPSSVSNEQLQALDAAYHLSDSNNHILLRSWLPITIEHHYSAADAAVRRHLLAVGRMYLITPVYKALIKTPEGRAEAQAIYAQAKPGYHPIAQAAVERILGSSPN